MAPHAAARGTNEELTGARACYLGADSSRPDYCAGAALTVARVCFLEAGFSRPDCAAMVGVARLRAARVGRPWVDVLVDYSALTEPNARARSVRSFPWGDVQKKGETFNAHWGALRAYVVEALDGQHPSPCPRAEHWGARNLESDKPSGRMVPARCWAKTRNVFYALGRRSKGAVSATLARGAR